VRYTGRLPRDRFKAWTDSPEGQPAVAQVASHIRFALFGRERAARRQLWNQLTAAARDHGVAAAIQQEIDGCLNWLDTLAHAQDLPRVTIEMYRLVAVPRFFMNAVTYRHVDAALRKQSAFMALEGGDAPRGWFVLTVIDAVEAALAAARPSPARPLPAGERWLTVGVNQQFEWRAPIQGPAWPGHYYVLERSPASMKRAFRKSANEAIAKLDASLPSLSVAHRTGILKQAGASLERMNAHL
jgi:hypothetical protein